MKATKSIINRVKSSPEQEAFVARVEITDTNVMTTICSDVAAECPNAVVMVLALDEQNNGILAGVCCPNIPTKLDFKKWLVDSTKSVTTKLNNNAKTAKKPVEIVMNDSNTVMCIRYDKNSEHYAFKLVDQIASEAFHLLIQLGIYHITDEEKEYNFDDI